MPDIHLDSYLHEKIPEFSLSGKILTATNKYIMFSKFVNNAVKIRQYDVKYQKLLQNFQLLSPLKKLRRQLCTNYINGKLIGFIINIL